MNLKMKLIGAAAAVVIGGTALGGIVLAERQAAPAQPLALQQLHDQVQNQSPPPVAPPPSTTAGNGATGVAGAKNAPNQAERQQLRDDFLNQLAQNLNVSRSTLNGALQTTFDQEIDTAVAQNILTAQQATRLKQRIANGTFPVNVRIGRGLKRQQNDPSGKPAAGGL